MSGAAWWSMTDRGTHCGSCRLIPAEAESRVLSRLRSTIARETLQSMLSVARLRLLD